jgi:hypothetical protein
MRKKLLSIFILTFLVASTLVGCSGDPTSTSSTLTIFSITEGTVLVMKAGADDWTQATPEMPLDVGDTIKTGDNSSAEITFFDGSTIELEAGTQIEITSLDTSPDTGTKTITLMQTIGTTISRVTKLLDPASSYAVETPSGVAAVRGSTLIVRIVFNDPNYEDGTVLMTCMEGDIWVIWNGVQVQIPQGYTCIIRPHQPLELVPPNETHQEETGGGTGEDTSSGETEDLQPGGPAAGNLTPPPMTPPPMVVYSDPPVFQTPPAPPTEGGNDQNGGETTGNETPGTNSTDGQNPPSGGGTTGNETLPVYTGPTGVIHVITPATTDALIYIDVETADGRVPATDFITGEPVVAYHGVSDRITLAANHHYYVWVQEDGSTYTVQNTDPYEWTISPDGQQADGDLGSDEQENVHFKVAGNGTGNNNN